MDDFKEYMVDGIKIKAEKSNGEYGSLDDGGLCSGFPREPFLKEKVIRNNDNDPIFVYIVDSDYIVWVTQPIVNEFFLSRPSISLCLGLIKDKDPEFNFFVMKYGENWEKNTEKIRENQIDEFKEYMVDGVKIKFVKSFGSEDEDGNPMVFPKEPFLAEKVMYDGDEISFAYIVDSNYIMWIPEQYEDDFCLSRPCMRFCHHDPDFDFFTLKYGPEWVRKCEENMKENTGDT